MEKKEVYRYITKLNHCNGKQISLATLTTNQAYYVTPENILIVEIIK